jgi:hypothetical protein
LLLDPVTAAAAVADGGLQQEAVITGEGEEKVEGWKRVAVGVTGLGLSVKQATRVGRRLQGLAGEGWQPLLLLPEEIGEAGGGGGSRSEGEEQQGSFLGLLRGMDGAGVIEGRCGGERNPAGGDVDPLELLRHPEQIRALLSQEQTTQQQQEGSREEAAAGGEAGAGCGLPVAGADVGSGLSDGEKARSLRQLRFVHRWQWQALQLQAEGAGAAVAAQLGEAVRGRWWKGELLRGSVLLEEAEVLEGTSQRSGEVNELRVQQASPAEAALGPSSSGDGAGCSRESSRASWFYGIAV